MENDAVVETNPPKFLEVEAEIVKRMTLEPKTLDQGNMKDRVLGSLTDNPRVEVEFYTRLETGDPSDRDFRRLDKPHFFLIKILGGLFTKRNFEKYFKNFFRILILARLRVCSSRYLQQQTYKLTNYGVDDKLCILYKIVKITED